MLIGEGQVPPAPWRRPCCDHSDLFAVKRNFSLICDALFTFFQTNVKMGMFRIQKPPTFPFWEHKK